MKRTILLSLFICAVPLQLSALAQSAPKPAAPACYAEMKQVFGAVPSFFKMIPAPQADGMWADFKGLWLSDTAIPGKYKDLISIAVASQIPCKYCVYADTQFARKLDSASEDEVKEAVLMASFTRKASTVLNGLAQDESEFKKEADKIFAFVKKGTKPAAAIQVTDAASAYKDIEATFGMVPTFIKHYPTGAVVGFWSQFKTIQLSPQTAIPGKYKELIGLAVAAQIPCRYCIYFHKQAATMAGASPQEIDEATAIAADTRQWSAIFYGMELDERTWKKEIDSMVKVMQKAMAPKTDPKPKAQ